MRQLSLAQCTLPAFKIKQNNLFILVDSRAPLGREGSEQRYRRKQELAARGAGSDGGRDGQQARERHYKIKRAGDAQEANGGIVTDAAKGAASKRSRSLASTGDIKGLYPGTATNEQNLSMAIADFIHSEALPEGVAVERNGRGVRGPGP